jgi:hypothetical protein
MVTVSSRNANVAALAGMVGPGSFSFQYKFKDKSIYVIFVESNHKLNITHHSWGFYSMQWVGRNPVLLEMYHSSIHFI